MGASKRNRPNRPRRAALLFERTPEGPRVAALYLDANNAQAEADRRNLELRPALLEASRAELEAARAELAEHPYSEAEIAILDAAQVANFAADPELASQAAQLVAAAPVHPARDLRERLRNLEDQLESLSDESRYLRSRGEARFYVGSGPLADTELTATFATTVRLRQMLLLVVEGRVAGLFRRPGPAHGLADRLNQAAYEGQLIGLEGSREAREAVAGDRATWCASPAAPAQVRIITVSDLAEENLLGYSPEAERRMERQRVFAQEEKARQTEEWLRGRAGAISAIKNLVAARERNDQIAALQYEMIRRDHDAQGAMLSVNERSIDVHVRAEGFREALLDIGDLTDDPSIHAVIRDVVGYSSRSEETS